MFDGLFIVDEVYKSGGNVHITYKKGVLIGFFIVISSFLAFIIAFGLVEKEKSDVALGLSVTIIVLLVIAVVYFIFVHNKKIHTRDETFAFLKEPSLIMGVERLEFWLFILLTFLSLFGVITVGIVKYFEGNEEWIDAISIFTVCLASILFLYVIVHIGKKDRKLNNVTDDEFNEFEKSIKGPDYFKESDRNDYFADPKLSLKQKISNLAGDLSVAMPRNIREKTEEEEDEREENRRYYNCDMTNEQLLNRECPKFEEIVNAKDL